MKPATPIEYLLRWRAARAEAEAPPPPRAARLLELTRPWWEAWPERFRAVTDRLNAMHVAYGHAMTKPQPARGAHLVPVIIVKRAGDLETTARMLFLNVRDGRVRLRFQLDAGAENDAAVFDATFLIDGRAQPAFHAPATRSLDSEYRIDSKLPSEFEVEWAQLKVTARMPFRLILRAPSAHSGAVGD